MIDILYVDIVEILGCLQKYLLGGQLVLEMVFGQLLAGNVVRDDYDHGVLLGRGDQGPGDFKPKVSPIFLAIADFKVTLAARWLGGDERLHRLDIFRMDQVQSAIAEELLAGVSQEIQCGRVGVFEKEIGEPTADDGIGQIVQYYFTEIGFEGIVYPQLQIFIQQYMLQYTAPYICQDFLRI